MSAKPIYQHDKTPKRPSKWPLLALVIVILAAVGVNYWSRAENRGSIISPNLPHRITPAPNTTTGAGSLLGVDDVKHFTAVEAQAVSKQNYGASTPVITTGVTKITFRYRSTDLNGQMLTIYGRAYLPDNATSKLPIFAFAPGTTGIGDQCAASVEQPQVVNWGNYDSHMITYATQGYAAVTTDYEGMRDDSRLHHYMVGQLEGRAVLDSIRALGQLPQAKNQLDTSKIFAAGYSQGGHAAFWADTINASYAPDIKLTGVIGYGPVLSVEETMNDITRGSILDWFGPYVLASYADYYHQNYGIEQILLPHWANTLSADVTSHCVDSVYSFWGHDASRVYTPAYLSSIGNGTFAQDYPVLAHDLEQNSTGTEATTSAKLINHGKYDVVVLPGESEAALPTMCANSKGPVALKIYSNATHFNTMVVSLRDTLTWMKTLRDGEKPASTCPPQ